MGTIVVRFVTGSDFISRAIAFAEKDGWPTHCDVKVTGGCLVGAHIDGGVQARPPNYDRTTMSCELYVSIDVPDEVEEKFNAFVNAQIGKPYDVTAIAGVVFGRDWRERDSWFCSELVAAALEDCGYLPMLASADNHISPRDLLLVLSGKFSIPNAA